jgi:hypothetical protein
VPSGHAAHGNVGPEPGLRAGRSTRTRHHAALLGKVDVVEEHRVREVRSVTFVFEMPAVVRLFRSS